MIDFSEVSLEHIVLHQVGNKTTEEGIVFSEHELELKDDNLIQLLLNYFLLPFNGVELFQFMHESDLGLNELYVYAGKLFSRKNNFMTQTEHIARHLYECSAHPKVKSGEVYIVYFKNIHLRDETADAIGIFKSESKDRFLKIDRIKNSFRLNAVEGVNTSKLDKGCLILNLDKDNGYKICIIDNLNKSAEARYWKDDFMKVTPIRNEFHQTNEFLTIAKNFVTKKFSEEFEVTRTDQIDLLNRSVEYFKTNDSFDKKDFEKTVFQDSGIIKSFRNYDEAYREEHNIEVDDTFDISLQAVKKQAKVFKSVLKLDKNFHIYIHGKRELIEQGVEKDGRKYYKIYFDQES
ncbi:MAG: nucleoid-associated protein [Bacteroidia bacterium]